MSWALGSPSAITPKDRDYGTEPRFTTHSIGCFVAPRLESTGFGVMGVEETDRIIRVLDEQVTAALVPYQTART